MVKIKINISIKMINSEKNQLNGKKNIYFENTPFENKERSNINPSNSEKEKKYGIFNELTNKKKRDREFGEIDILQEFRRKARKLTNGELLNEYGIADGEGDSDGVCEYEYSTPQLKSLINVFRWELNSMKSNDKIYIQNKKTVDAMKKSNKESDGKDTIIKSCEREIEGYFIEDVYDFNKKSIDKKNELIKWIKETIFHVCIRAKSYYICKSKNYYGEIMYERNTSEQMRKTGYNNYLYDPSKEKEKDRYVPIWKFIFRHRTDKKYFVFDPTPDRLCKRDRSSIINLFTGFRHNTIDKFIVDKSKFKVINDHIFNILSRGNNEYYQYIISWLARIIQKPHEKNGVALVFKSKQGSGKGIIVDFVGNCILGPKYYVQIKDVEKLVGRFNSNMENKLLTHLDEAQNFGGSRRINNFMKSILTQTQINIEKKGIDPITLRDYNNYIITTNNDFPVKIEEYNRRYACFLALSKSDDKFNEHISNYAKSVHGYFDILAKECCNIESQVHFFHYLMQYNINKFYAEKIPKTQFIKDLKNRSDSPILKYIKDLCEYFNGITSSNENIDSVFGHFSSVMDRSNNKLKIWSRDLWKVFLEWKKVNNVIASINSKHFYMGLKNYLNIKQVKIKGKNSNGINCSLQELNQIINK